jgi:hypothetical protein
VSGLSGRSVEFLAGLGAIGEAGGREAIALDDCERLTSQKPRQIVRKVTRF